MTQALLYNLTIKVEKDNEDSFVAYLSRILEIVEKSPILESIQLNKILFEEPDGQSYSVQFTFKSKYVFEKEKLTVLRPFIEKLDEKYKGQYVYFGTMMDVIETYKKSKIV